jgi:anthranilate phosphoribosyltransferase
VVLLNGAAALLAGGAAENMRDGIVQAAQVIDSGAALAKLEGLVAFSQRHAKPAA